MSLRFIFFKNTFLHFFKQPIRASKQSSVTDFRATNLPHFNVVARHLDHRHPWESCWLPSRVVWTIDIVSTTVAGLLGSAMFEQEQDRLTLDGVLHGLDRTTPSSGCVTVIRTIPLPVECATLPILHCRIFPSLVRIAKIATQQHEILWTKETNFDNGRQRQTCNTYIICISGPDKRQSFRKNTPGIWQMHGRFLPTKNKEG